MAGQKTKLKRTLMIISAITADLICNEGRAGTAGPFLFFTQLERQQLAAPGAQYALIAAYLDDPEGAIPRVICSLRWAGLHSRRGNFRKPDQST